MPSGPSMSRRMPRPRGPRGRRGPPSRSPRSARRLRRHRADGQARDEAGLPLGEQQREDPVEELRRWRPLGRRLSAPSARHTRPGRWRGPSHLSGRVLSRHTFGAAGGAAKGDSDGSGPGRRSPIARGGNPLPLALRFAPLFRHARRGSAAGTFVGGRARRSGGRHHGDRPSPGARDPHPGGCGGSSRLPIAISVVGDGVPAAVRSRHWPTGQGGPAPHRLPALADPRPSAPRSGPSRWRDDLLDR